MPPDEAEGFVWASSPSCRSGKGLEVYAPPAEVELRLLAARIGEAVTMPQLGQPPWIVVNYRLESVLVSGWPGRLLRVRLAPPRTAEEREAVDAANRGIRGGKYVRAYAVTVVEELSPELLFGPQGRAVVAVIERASALVPQQVQALADARHADAAAAYARVWEHWSARPPAPGVIRLYDPNRNPGSPIGHGLMIVSKQADIQGARHAAIRWEIDPDDPEDDGYTLAPVWRQAKCALLEAALALGAPTVVGDDLPVLIQAWDRVFGA